jgi:hypothetical protein
MVIGVFICCCVADVNFIRCTYLFPCLATSLLKLPFSPFPFSMEFKRLYYGLHCELSLSCYYESKCRHLYSINLLAHVLYLDP